MPVDYRLASGPSVIEASRQGHIAVIPTGSLEQHCRGPLGVDGLIAERIAWESCKLLEERKGLVCIILPTIYYGFSPEWQGTPGTITTRLETFKNLIWDILSSLAQQGFKRIAIVNGHGGNTLVLEAVVREWLEGGYPTYIALIDYWKVAGLRIGHADRGEEEIAGYLGIKAKFSECQQTATIAREYKILTKPPKTTIGVEDETKQIEPGKIIDGVYKALLELAEYKADTYNL